MENPSRSQLALLGARAGLVWLSGCTRGHFSASSSEPPCLPQLSGALTFPLHPCTQSGSQPALAAFPSGLPSPFPWTTCTKIASLHKHQVLHYLEAQNPSTCLSQSLYMAVGLGFLPISASASESLMTLMKPLPHTLQALPGSMARNCSEQCSALLRSSITNTPLKSHRKTKLAFYSLSKQAINTNLQRQSREPC